MALLDDIMSQEHSQRDMVWQPDTTGGGRERMANGITAYRKMMPDLVFTLVGLAGDEASQRCYVEFEATGTEAAPQAGEERRAAQIAGAAVLQVCPSGVTIYALCRPGKSCIFLYGTVHYTVFIQNVRRLYTMLLYTMLFDRIYWKI